MLIVNLFQELCNSFSTVLVAVEPSSFLAANVHRHLGSMLTKYKLSVTVMNAFVNFCGYRYSLSNTEDDGFL